MDTGDASVAPDSVNVPFIITPLIFRIEPHTGQTLRIMYTGEALPNDCILYPSDAAAELTREDLGRRRYSTTHIHKYLSKICTSYILNHQHLQPCCST
ncbi:fimbria/pilus periplasmic chaperone [Klebsiella pneumoniae]|nr:fimbria/pilus periplasmic chaperone [Klebsiella pneumoniae]MDK9466752.1 fimbria/pilus periplasmic chaperone [Klebsiella pneumoniae]